MNEETKKWKIQYDYHDGRKGTDIVTTIITKSKSFNYGNGLCGILVIDDFNWSYDLRYMIPGDLHRAMINELFGSRNLVDVSEVTA